MKSKIVKDSLIVRIGVRECTKFTPRTVSSLLDILAHCRLIYLHMELLFCTRVAVRTVVALLAFARIDPLVSLFCIRARRTSVFEDFGGSATIFIVMILGASITLKTSRSITQLGLVII